MTSFAMASSEEAQILTGTSARPFEQAVRMHLPGRTVQQVKDRGVWERQIVEVILDGGEIVFFKINVQADWNVTQNEVAATRLFHARKLPAPRILVLDTSGEIIPRPYVIQERVGGMRLGALLEQVDEADTWRIYETLGRLYGKMHAIHNDRSGVWAGTPERTLEVSPNDYMYQAEIVEGSGQRALVEGRITQRTYDRIVSLWAEHMAYLKDHQPSLIHFSPFFWTIYLDRDTRGWRVTKLTALGDVLWWDSACNLAFLQYPPFGEVGPERWQAFLRGYGPAPERKRILLYALMQRLCAAMGVYKELQTAQNKAWAANCLQDLDIFMNEIEGKRLT